MSGFLMPPSARASTPAAVKAMSAKGAYDPGDSGDAAAREALVSEYVNVHLRVEAFLAKIHALSAEVQQIQSDTPDNQNLYRLIAEMNAICDMSDADVERQNQLRDLLGLN